MRGIDILIQDAKQASNFAYAPYSKFKVGAALLTESGKIYSGANVENASYGLTVCAERVALFKAVSDGEKNFTALVIYTKTKDFTMPCGACRQVLAEFNQNLSIIIVNQENKILKTTLTKLLPNPFKKNNLRK
jgi:cytidine deaminase